MAEGPRAKEPRNAALEAGKDKEPDCPVQPPEGAWPDNIFISAQWK